MYLPMLRRPVAARRRGMPGIAVFGKHFFKKDPGEAKSSAEKEQRYTVAIAFDGANRWENYRAQTRAAKQFARAPCRDVAGVVEQFDLHQSPARRSQCGRTADGKSVFHQT
jgi:hypothetical protein